MLLVSLYLAALFVALTPGVLLTLPKGGKRLTVAVVHGLVFASIWYFTRNAVLRATEGFQGRAGPQGQTGRSCMFSTECNTGVCAGAVIGRAAAAEVLGTCLGMKTRCKSNDDCGKGRGQCTNYSPATTAIQSIRGTCT